MQMKDSIRQQMAAKTERLEYLTNLDKATKTQEDEKHKLQEQLTKLNQKLVDVEDHEEKRDDYRREILAYLNKNDYYWVTDIDSWMRLENGKGTPVKDRAIKNELNILKNTECYKIFDEILEEQGRKYQKVTYTFRDVANNTLNLMSTSNWISIDQNALVKYSETGELPDYHPIFDLLMRSLSHEKKENRDHIERVVAAKYLQPDNYLLPCVIIYGQSGGVGKNLFIERVLTTIFGRPQIAVTTVDHVVGQFNTVVEGKTVVYIDESVDDRVDEHKLKATLGTNNVTINPKGINPYEQDNLALYFISGNGTRGSVKLAGEDTDRRFSVIHADRPLKYLLADEWGVSSDEAESMMRTQYQKILSDPSEVSRWLTHIICKHDAPTDVQALHGEDFNALLSIQEPTWQTLCRRVFYEEGYSYVKAQTLYEVLKLWTARDNPAVRCIGKKTFYAEVDRWLKKQGYNFVRDRVTWTVGTGRSSAEVYKESSLPKTLKDNDDDFIQYKDNGRMDLMLE